MSPSPSQLPNSNRMSHLQTLNQTRGLVEHEFARLQIQHLGRILHRHRSRHCQHRWHRRKGFSRFCPDNVIGDLCGHRNQLDLLHAEKKMASVGPMKLESRWLNRHQNLMRRGSTDRQRPQDRGRHDFWRHSWRAGRLGSADGTPQYHRMRCDRMRPWSVCCHLVDETHVWNTKE